MDDSAGVLAATQHQASAEETLDAARLSHAARAALPFVHAGSDGSERFWHLPDGCSGSDCAERRVAGERWALDLLRYYRKFGHESAARMLPEVLCAGFETGHASEEHFKGFLRVLDAMLAFAARQCDLDAYAEALDVEHQRTLAAWKTLDPG